MVTSVEEIVQGNTEQAHEIPSGGGTSRWSFSPLQAIPKNAESLWNLMETVYFSAIPPGHEILECLRGSAIEYKSNETSYEHLKAPEICFTYAIEGTNVKLSENPVTRARVCITSNENYHGVLFADNFLPLSAPPTQKFNGKPRPEQSGSTTPTPSWTLTDATVDSPMRDEDSDKETELRFLEIELSRIRGAKNAIIKNLLVKVESEVRPNKKAWFDAEQNLLALYEKKPPSAFQASSAASEIKDLPLSALGKVDSSLPDSFKDAELCCSICGEGDTTDDNDILICDGCSFAAHQACYFVKNIPDGSWYCQLCDAYFRTKGGSRKNSRRLNSGESGMAGLDDYLDSSVTCSLCLQAGSFVGGGLMKPTSNNGWAHVKCALWVPEAAFPADGLSITVIQNKDRENLRCTLCKLKGGCPLQCAFGKCTAAFHVSCAARAGLLPEEKNLKNLFCARHIKIQMKMSPCTSRLLSLRKQDWYIKSMNDKFVAPKIGGSLFTPSYSPIVDAEQSFLLQIAAVHPLIHKQIAGPGFVAPTDLMEIDQTFPLLKDLSGDIVSFPALIAERGGPTEMGRDTFIDISCCSECMRPMSETRDLIIKCISCGLYAHSMCYDRAGVPTPNVDDLMMGPLCRVLKYDTSKWGGRKTGCISITCTRCELFNSGTVQSMAKTHCLLCMQMGGLVLPLQDLDEEEQDTGTASSIDENPQESAHIAFAHPRCVWWLLASSVTNLLSSPPMQLKSISASYHFHMCAVCGSRQGCTVRCARVGCNRRFHISCGFHAGAYFSVRSTSGLVAGSRDQEEDPEIVLDNLVQVIKGEIMSRRVVTCWSHEQRGMRRIAAQLGRTGPTKAELVRWVPEGIRTDLVGLVNRVLAGEVGPHMLLPDQTTKKKSMTRRMKEEMSDSDSGTVKRKRGRPRMESSKFEKEKLQTVRFIDGMEVTCEDEDWEGGCTLCGKAWTDSKGQVLESICCDKCDQWYHFSCVGIERAPTGDFICPTCME